MSEAANSIRHRIARGDAFNRDELAALMAVSDDLDLWSALYEVLEDAYWRVEPEAGMHMTCSFMIGYLIRCIRENPPSDLSSNVHTGHEAAYELAACLKHWSSKLPETAELMQLAERSIANVFAAGDDRVRNNLINGTLEHALESKRVRPYFEHWARDPILRTAWELAMDWAVNRGDAE
jgi:hypothetical protein